MPPVPPQLTGEGLLGAEVISSQTGVVNLQQDTGVVHGGREDLKRWDNSHITGWGSSAQTWVLRWVFLPGGQEVAASFRKVPLPPSLSHLLCVIVDIVWASQSLMR